MAGKKFLVAGDVDEDFYALLDHIPAHDEGLLADQGFSLRRGKAGNSAYVLSSLGSDTSLFAVVGNDKRGEVALSKLKKENVDLSLVVENGKETTLCIMMLDGSGEKALIVIPSDDIYPGEEYASKLEGKLDSFDHVHMIGMNPEKIGWIARECKKRNIPVSLDIDSANGGLERFSSVLEDADIVFLNKQGLLSLSGCIGDDGRDGLEVLSKKFPSTLLIATLGRDGASCIAEGKLHHADALMVKALDTTGCGDAFSAGFIHAFVDLLYPIDEALAFASKCASISALSYGGQGGSWHDI